MRLKEAGVRAQSVIREGDPAREIISYANERPFAVIVMSSHGRSGLSAWAFGSVADKVLRSARSSVFLVRPKTMVSSKKGEESG